MKAGSANSDGSYMAFDLPITVTFPIDLDGVSRICVVEATLPSREEQQQLQMALEVLLKQEPIKQADSVIWMFGSPPDVRGLQFFLDPESDEPQIRLIGAAF